MKQIRLKVQHHDTTHEIECKTFDSLIEAIEELGDVQVLNYINNGYIAKQRNQIVNFFKKSEK